MIDLDKLPKEPGVYLMKNKRGEILYIGKAKELRKRVKQYFVPGRDGRMMVPFLTSQVEEIDTIVTFSEKEALLLENTLIKKHQPKYNVLLKDDKTFISLTINHKHRWPIIRIARYRGKPPGKGLHFGPYTSAFAARQTLDLMNRVFKLRQCSDRELTSRSRPCLLYGIKRCLAPCVDKCTHEVYETEVKRAIEFLKGHDKAILRDLKKEMETASENLEFERAGSLHKTIGQIEHVTKSRQAIIRAKGKDCDIFALYHEGKHHIIAQLMFREGRLTGADHFKFIELASTDEEIWESFLLQHYQNQDKRPPEILLPITLKKESLLEEILELSLVHPKKGEKVHLLELAKKNAKALFTEELSKEELLLDLQETCGLDRCPVRIECFDTSNISGTDLVACMVGFTDGKRDKERTRLFNIKQIDTGDDYGALREVLTRHYTKAKEKDELPDLALIDGGKGQLNVALDVFKELEIANVDVISLAKEEGRHDKGLNFEKIFVPHKKDPIFLSPRSSTLFILQQIRDEAHRVAITHHRKRRTKRIIQTELDTLPGIGPKKRSLLLKHFGSVKQIKKASREALERAPGLTKKDIETIFTWKSKL
ncbi:excinuclease ABC subunit UvrC [Candidatus Neptunochlamydia vexilliferae]|uniref:UvrABC system protein C n=1 Tax=Candidatus Neptunichlamydia vexilliferae TaxID=1651774 RepID=A0ABS0AWR0_9BACT|nr:excinuclease ABC subunit UvrC [Candidatus Neptunochlamydia vexilliferae]MBF5058565.1 UvrABC system protein C [Candidatus Neptunochlamydia vexilliferae]